MAQLIRLRTASTFPPDLANNFSADADPTWSLEALVEPGV
jgi:hypothetical protein